ncbi:hypothetical protein G6R40_02845 [Chryseobacterium sp. POL2]|uniref:hypothetical protein n=1 Tax=Chryseobacterium sp. POL2 TaxID=2713414 RepID=UPI0013E15475|nr:hypothetical protein [Chryseobacterium sp. POL2]QIG88669.1 hypothetical protein G6R40_02845 [Chryseobacterium sp. POL2]
MWTIIIILVAIFIIWAIVSNNKDNEKIRDFYIQTGGLVARHKNFTDILEQDYDMVLKYDDGRRFCFKKQLSTGELNIGLKLESDNSGTIFSEIIENGVNRKGQNVVYRDLGKERLRDSIKLSVNNIYRN